MTNTETATVELTETQKAYNLAQYEMFQLAAYGHCTYTNGELLTDEGKRQQADYNDRIRAAREELEAALLRLVAEHAETFRGDWGVPAAWLRSLADDPAGLSLLAVRPDEREHEAAPAAVSVPPPAPRADDRAALRDLAAEAIRAAACPGSDCRLSEAECSEQRIQPAAWERGVLSEVYGRPEWFADAVLAELPEPADRAVVFREAANALAAVGLEDSLVSGPRAWAEAIETLRRLADEAQQPRIPRCPSCGHHSCDGDGPCGALLGVTVTSKKRCACPGPGAEGPGGPCVAGEQQNETPEAETPTTTKPETTADRDTLRRQFGDVLRRWGLLDEQIDQRAAEDAAVADLLALLPEQTSRDAEIEHLRDRLASCRERVGIAAGKAIAAEDAITRARQARRRLTSALIAVEPLLTEPYPDDPRWTPWTRFVGPALKELSDALKTGPAANDEPAAGVRQDGAQPQGWYRTAGFDQHDDYRTEAPE